MYNTVIFSKKCEYGLQATLYLAANAEREAITAEEIAKQLSIPKEFVSKILQGLTESGLVTSKKGKSGGFALAKDPKRIRLLDVVGAIDGLDIFNNCVLGFPKCSPDNPCPLHNKWGELRMKTYNMLTDETLDRFKESTLAKIKSQRF